MSDNGSPQRRPIAAPADDETTLPGDTSIDWILRRQSQLEQLVREHERRIAVLFADIVGSTAYFEQHGDAAGRRMIQRANDLVVPAVEASGGRVVKTIGDAVMATFPSAQRAVDAAMGMQRAFAQANAHALAPADRIQIRVGINFGTGLVDDKSGDVHGDMVNVAARVQSKARADQILVAEAVRPGLSSTVPLREAGLFQLKGKSEEFLLWEVLWEEHTQEPAAMDPPRIDPRYVVLGTLGAGGMASVWRARDERLGRDVAVKVLHRHVQLSATTRERFEREARIAAQLTHENVVQVYDWSNEGGESFISMELVEGTTLRALVYERGATPSAIVALLGAEIAEGLAYAHRKKVIHRDIKPDNVLVSRLGQVKIGDFGIAGIGDSVKMTAGGNVVGTAEYLSPERVTGGPADARSDQYALGVVLYEMANGLLPVTGDNPTAIMYAILEAKYAPPSSIKGIDPQLARIVARAMAKEPAQRYASCDELASDLRGLAKQLGVEDPRRTLQAWVETGAAPATAPAIAAPTHHSAPVKIPSRRVTWKLLAPLAALVLAGALGVMLALRSDPPEETSSAPQPANPAAFAAVRSATLPAPTKDPAAELPAAPPDLALAPPRTPAPAAAPVRPAAPKPGTLALEVDGGWARIRVDGTERGRYPETQSLNLPPGTHKLELLNDYRQPVRRDVVIEAGKRVVVRAELKPL